MNSSDNSHWGWIWPKVGPTPTTEGLDSEIFDRDDFPYSETFVREAIQNSLDARINAEAPVRIDFKFGTSAIDPKQSLLRDVISFRKKCDLPVPSSWDSSEMTWLVVQDFHATGLTGSLSRRNSDFWNYWLNFGQSNKDASGRGGRGIGRVTFLIASEIQTVVGYTRRSEDKKTPICGMAVLRSIEDDSSLRATHAYFAAREQVSIYHLHESADCRQSVLETFQFLDYEEVSDTGLALAIPYPHSELTSESILAAAIENFGPTIIDETLVLNVDGTRLDCHSIDGIAIRVCEKMRNTSIKSDTKRYLSLIRKGLTKSPPDYRISVPEGARTLDYLEHRETASKIEDHLQAGGSCVLELGLLVRHEGSKKATKLRAAITNCPEGASPLDGFFREGMCLPMVRSKDPKDFDLLFFVDESILATYLNLCEGKAHLDLSESIEIRQKLERHHFDAPVYNLKRFVKGLPRDLRLLLYGDSSQPDSRVFENLFAIRKGPPIKKKARDGQPVPPDIPPKRGPRAFRVSKHLDGLRIVAANDHDQWPVDLSAELAYADGSRHPRWNEADFEIEKLTITHKDEKKGCAAFRAESNVLEARKCTKNFDLRITGFDTNRELVVLWRQDSDANGS